MEITSEKKLEQQLEKLLDPRNKSKTPNHAISLKRITGEAENLTPNQKEEFISYLIPKLSQMYELFQNYKKTGEIKKLKKIFPKTTTSPLNNSFSFEEPADDIIY